MVRVVAAALLVVCFSAGAARGKEDEPEPRSTSRPEWVKFMTKEHGDGPRLVCVRQNGEQIERKAKADGMVISYLAQGNFGRMTNMSIDQTDRNRALLHFDLTGLEKAHAAELVMRVAPGSIPLTENLAAGIYPIQEPWEEHKTTWNVQPKIAPEPEVTFEIAPGISEIRVDVTNVVRDAAAQAATFHGWVIKAEKPLKFVAPQPMSGPPQPTVLPEFMKLVEWAGTPAQGMAKAKAEKKPVLCFVRCAYGDNGKSDVEEIFLATVLADPNVRDLVRAHFVPTRAHYGGNAWTAKFLRGPDPLAPLGSSAKEVKPFALLVTGDDGKPVDSIEGIGTFDPELVHEFLLGALAKAKVKIGKKPKFVPPPADYIEGARKHKATDRNGAVESWNKLPKDSPYQLKVRAWHAWPERMAMYEVLEKPKYTRKGTSTELPFAEGKVKELEKHAIDYLLAQQQPNGSWLLGARHMQWVPPVTALVARALDIRADTLKGEQKTRAAAAVQKAIDWLKHWMQGDVANADSFGTAYALDLFLDRFEKDESFKHEAQKAVAFHVGGQVENGAWSYNAAFAKRWKGGFGGWPETDKGRVHSMNTAPSLIPLVRAKKLGLVVEDKVLEKGKDVLMKMRDAPGVFTYTYPEPRNFNKLESSIGRAPGCEHALFLLQATKIEDVRTALDTFMQYRADLRTVAKVTGSWTAPRGVSAYFYFFAYYHAARAAQLLPQSERKQIMKQLRKDVLQVVEVDGTWLDWDGAGKNFGTASALMLLHMSR